MYTQRMLWATLFFLLLLEMPLLATALEALGLTSYHELITNHYDFSILDRADELLQSLAKVTTRPSHCPLNQTTGQDLLEKLQHLQSALATTRCKENDIGFLTSFTLSVVKLGQTYSQAGNQDINAMIATSAEQARSRTVNDMVSSLSGLLSDSRCALDLKERGLIPVVADILGSASVSALFIPNQYAFAAGMTGLAITSSLKIIGSLLKPDYDMTKAKDRENFVKLACSFYDVRSDLEKSNFFRVPSSRDIRNQILLSSTAESIGSMVAWLDLAKTDSLAILKHLKEDHVIAQMGAEKFAFYKYVPSYQARLSPPEVVADDKAPSRDLAFRLNVLKTLEDISTRLPKISIDKEHYRLFIDVESDFALLKNFRDTLFAPKAYQQSDHDLVSGFLSALNNIGAILTQEVLEAEKTWSMQFAYGNVTFAQLQEEIPLRFDVKIAALQKMFERLSEKELEVSKIIARKNFTNDDEGTHIDHAIVEEIKSIQKAIYGHYGWRFYEYVRDGATKELAAFYLNNREFRRKHLPTASDEKIAPEHTRRVACATVANLLLSINNSRSLVNMATDFIFTNRDFFHENVGFIDFHLKVIPTGRAIERQLLNEAQALINAKATIGQSRRSKFPAIVLQANFFKRPHLSDLMLAQIYAERRMGRLYRFQALNECN